MKDLELIATTTFGLESVVKDEVKRLGFDLQGVENGKVTFKGDFTDLARANLWLRSAERVLVKVGEFKAVDFDQLYEQTKALPWADWLPENATFPVQGKSVRSELHSVPTCQSIVKKAVVDSMKERYHQQWFPEDGTEYKIEVALLNDVATLTLDSSGEGLHKRGYRKLSTEAPLQETLAAGMIYLSKWNPDRILIDPFCGSGTIPIEAAMMGLNLAPGLNRSFAAEDWSVIPHSVWDQARAEARDLVKKDVQPRLIMGNDIDDNAVGIARYHAREAGVEEQVHFQTAPLSDFETSRKYGYIITNPPYGERLGEKEEVEQLYKKLGRKLLSHDSWSFYFLTSHKDFENLFGKKASKRRKLFNGGIEVHYYQYYGPWPPRST